MRQVTPTLHEAPAIEQRSYQDVTGIQLHTFLFTGWIEVSSPSFQGRERGVHAPSEPAPPLIANLERLASLRQSGALYEPEYERLQGVLLAAADGGMTPVAPRNYTDSS